jgi:hypothetical protein
MSKFIRADLGKYLCDDLITYGVLPAYEAIMKEEWQNKFQTVMVDLEEAFDESVKEARHFWKCYSQCQLDSGAAEIFWKVKHIGHLYDDEFEWREYEEQRLRDYIDSGAYDNDAFY